MGLCHCAIRQELNELDVLAFHPGGREGEVALLHVFLCYTETGSSSGKPKTKHKSYMYINKYYVSIIIIIILCTNYIVFKYLPLQC